MFNRFIDVRFLYNLKCYVYATHVRSHSAQILQRGSRVNKDTVLRTLIYSTTEQLKRYYNRENSERESAFLTIPELQTKRRP